MKIEWVYSLDWKVLFFSSGINTTGKNSTKSNNMNTWAYCVFGFEMFVIINHNLYLAPASFSQ